MFIKISNESQFDRLVVFTRHSTFLTFYYLLCTIMQLNAIWLYCMVLCGWMRARWSEDQRWESCCQLLANDCIRKVIWLNKLCSKTWLISGNCLTGMGTCVDRETLSALWVCLLLFEGTISIWRLANVITCD